MTKRKYKKLSIILMIVIIGMGWILSHPKAYNRMHGHIRYQMVKNIVPDWIGDWFDPRSYDIKK